MSSGSQSATESTPSLVRDGTLIFLTVFIAGIFSFEFAQKLSGIYPVWWPNGVLLAPLLLVRKRRWPPLLGVGGLAILLAHAPIPAWQPHILWLTITCLAEVWLAATLIRWWADGPFTLTSVRQATRFVIIAVLLTPLVSTVCALAVIPLPPGQSLGSAFLHWYIADAIGIATATPVMLAAYQGSIPKTWNHARTMESAGLLILLIVGGSICLFQPDMAILGLLFPLVIAVVVRMGWIIGALGVLTMSVIASGFSVTGHGPFAALYAANSGNKILELQVFLTALTISTAIVATVYEDRRRMLQQTREKERSIRLLTENSPDVMLLNDLSSRMLYATRAVKGMLGYEAIELYRKNFPSDLMHPEEVPAYMDALDAIRRQNESRTLIYRIHRKDNSWMWAEGCVSLYRDEISGEPLGFVNVLRDITHRKEADDRLQSAYNELEILAAIDALTGVANRRNFDAVLDSEWKRAIRSGTTLAMLLIDVDFFKNFNDIYGHIEGDDCLRDIASIVAQCTRCATDVVARFGGEEFAAVLPETDEAGAAALAERIRATVQSHAVRHAGNIHGVVTVSIGCAAMVPTRGSNPLPLIEAADKALYRGKSIGRNTIVRASQMD